MELLSPVGSFESLIAAVQSGANAIYFGIDKLNMRSASSVNFTLDDLERIVQICKENNVGSYITLNTVMYDEDIELCKTIIDAAKRSRVDGIIASDFAVISYANRVGLTVHVSTQSNVSNIEAVKFFSQFADVMVLARELSIEQVKNITDTIEKEQIKGSSGKLIKIEIFGHGALCMSVSGKCYLSLHNMNSSANRGQCLQLCRRPYKVTDLDGGYELAIDNEYIMSPKDLCTIGFLDKIIEAGVEVLKIEGRGRSPEYVKIVTETYREAIDAYYSGNYTWEKIELWTEKLKTVYNRGFWDGYYMGKKLGEWTKKYGSQATTRKEYVGKVTNYFSNLKVAEVKIETGSLSLNDDIYIIGTTTGVIEEKLTEIRVDLASVNIANKGDLCSIPTKVIVRRSDKIYKIVKSE